MRCTAASAITSNSLATPVGHLAQPVQRRRVGGVVEVVDLLAVVVVAHHADEEVHAAGRGIVHRGEHLGRIERGLAEVEQPDHGRLVGRRC